MTKLGRSSSIPGFLPMAYVHGLPLGGKWDNAVLSFPLISTKPFPCSFYFHGIRVVLPSFHSHRIPIGPKVSMGILDIDKSLIDTDSISQRP